MAWISVHEQVLGGKLRSLAKEIGCSQNEALGILVRLWLWGINNADREGRIIGANKEDVAEVLNIGIDARYSSMDVIEALIETNWIDFEDDLFLHDWDEWQEQWYKAIAVREKDAARKREERKMARMQKKQNSKESEKDMEADLPSPKLIIPLAEEQKSQPDEPKKEEKKTEEYPEGFNQFWEVYPKKVGKGEAYKKYKARINSGWSPDELLEAAKNYASKVIRERTDKKYIKHPKTFLSENEPFVDFLTVKKVETSNDDDPYGEWR